MQEVVIKGTKYKVVFTDDTFILNDNAVCGSIDYEKKEIKISTKYESNIESCIYHELAHGYLRECGLTGYAADETLVEWIAQNIEDIIKSGKEILKKVKK